MYTSTKYFVVYIYETYSDEGYLPYTISERIKSFNKCTCLVSSANEPRTILKSGLYNYFCFTRSYKIFNHNQKNKVLIRVNIDTIENTGNFFFGLN